MSDSKSYCVGWLFTLNAETKARGVVLVRKTHPEWQRGRLNGIGGKLLPGEFPYDAMLREGGEELGALLPDSANLPWAAVGCTRFHNGISVYSYAARVTLTSDHVLGTIGATVPMEGSDETITVVPFLDETWQSRTDLLYDVRLQVEQAKLVLNMRGDFLHPSVDASDVGHLVFATSALPPEMRSVYSQRAPKVEV